MPRIKTINRKTDGTKYSARKDSTTITESTDAKTRKPNKRFSFTAEKPSYKKAVNPSREQIAEKAYSLYLARGCQNGFHDQDWIKAEELLRKGK